MGRAGYWFSCQHWNVVPDIITLAKSLGAGLPLGAILSTQKIFSTFLDPPLSHLTTFGGNPISCAAAIAAFDIIKKDNLLEKAKELGKYLKTNSKKKGSLIETAYDNNVPIFCPAFTDSSAGFGLVMHQEKNPKKCITIDSIREVWWDIRPHPGFGTVEVRGCDAVPSIEEMVNLAALAQCLVVGLSNLYDDGAQLAILDPWVIHENKWRATRYGIDADIIVDEGGSLQSLKGAILETIDKILPIAEDLGCQHELIQLGDIVENNQAPYQLSLIHI